MPTSAKAPPPLRGLAAARATASFVRDPIATMQRLHAQHGRRIAVGQSRWLREREHLYVLALGPEFNRRILGDPDTFRTTGQGLSGPRGSALRRIRNGLTRSRGEKHARMRQQLAPLFQIRGIERAWPQIVAAVERCSAQWSPGEVVDLSADMRTLSLAVASNVLFGIDEPARAARLAQMLRDFAGLSFSLGVLAFARDWPGTPYRSLLRRAEAIEREVLGMIAARRKGGADGNDAIARMLSAVDEGWLDEGELVGQVNLLFAASHETTAIALTWTLVLLSQHPAVLGDLRDELDGHLGGGVMPLDAADRLPLLDAVVKESLRLLPPVPYTIRTTTRAVDADEFEGLGLRRGDTVLCSHYFTHHLAELWPEPERFLPSRWTGHRVDPAVYLPFSMAPRACIGATFATHVIKVALSILLQRHGFEVPPGTRIDRRVRVTMGPHAGPRMRIHAPGTLASGGGLRGNLREMVALPG